MTTCEQSVDLSQTEPHNATDEMASLIGFRVGLRTTATHLAGFMAAPVKGPAAKEPTMTVRPIASGANGSNLVT